MLDGMLKQDEIMYLGQHSWKMAALVIYAGSVLGRDWVGSSLYSDLYDWCPCLQIPREPYMKKSSTCHRETCCFSDLFLKHRSKGKLIETLE